MSQIRRKKKLKNFVTLDCTAVRDEKLSWQAKGLHTYLMQLPEDWEIFIKDLQNRATNGRDSTSAILNELINNGYVVRNRVTEKGKFVGYEYDIYEQKLEKIEKTENGFSEYGKTEYGKTEYGKTDTTNILKEVSINSNNLLKESSSSDVEEKEEKKEEFFIKNIENTETEIVQKKEVLEVAPAAEPPRVVTVEERVFIQIQTWIKTNTEKWLMMKESAKLVGLKRDDVIDEILNSIRFWLSSRNFAQTLKDNPTDFFEKHFVSSVLKRPVGKNGAKIVQFKAEVTIQRSKQQVEFIINQRFNYYADKFNQGHIARLCEAMTDSELSERLARMVESFKNQIDNHPRQGETKLAL
jgi:hypothetical protein